MMKGGREMKEGTEGRLTLMLSIITGVRLLRTATLPLLQRTRGSVARTGSGEPSGAVCLTFGRAFPVVPEAVPCGLEGSLMWKNQHGLTCLFMTVATEDALQWCLFSSECLIACYSVR